MATEILVPAPGRTPADEKDPGPGLTQAEALARFQEEGPNEIPRPKRRRGLKLVGEIVREPMILLLLASGTIYLLLGDLGEALFLLGSIGIVIAIEYFQERKTERALEALRDLSSPRAAVLRDGRVLRIPGREVVRGDLVLVSEGDRIPADGIVVRTLGLSVDESLLTGESVPVRKAPWSDGPATGAPGGDGTPFVFSGTLVVRGKADVQVTATGGRTQFGKIGKSIESEPAERSLIQKETERLVRLSAAAALLFCIAVTLLYGFTRHAWLEAILAGLALAISLLPEEFPVILTVFLALGAWRIARNRVLTRRTPAIEMLGAATVLCVDKTGTLTWNRMEVRALGSKEGWAEVDGGSGSTEPLLEAAVLASQRDPIDPMDKAVRELGDRKLRATGRLHPDWTLVREYPLSNKLLALIRVWKPAAGSGFVVAAKGAPEAILELCRPEPGEAARISRDVAAGADRGHRVLGVAHARWEEGELPADPRRFEFEFLGLIGFEDPVRPSVPPALRECAAAGVRTVMITGDYPGTARSVGRAIGLPGAEEMLTGPQMASLDDATLRERVRVAGIYARMVPDQKLRLVNALKANGEIVAMTGDGVNDAPALKAAHIGIAMGQRGTDVARESASLVLLDDDFASIVQAIRQGRRIFDNLRKAMAYVLAIHVPIAGTAFFPVLLDWPLILFAAHIVFLELIIDPICSVAFEGEPEDPGVMRRPPRRPEESLISLKTWVVSALQGGGVLAAVLASFVAARAQGWSEGECRSLAFAVLVGGNLGLILANRSWSIPARGRLRNPVMAALLLAAPVLLAAVVYVPWIGRFFKFEPIRGSGLALVGAGALGCLLWSAGVGVIARARKRIG